VLECHRISGDHDILLKARFESVAAYDEFRSARLTKIKGVQRITSSIVFSSAKDEGKVVCVAGKSPKRVRNQERG